MKITQQHALFYASKKNSSFSHLKDLPSVHHLINSQNERSEKDFEKHNDLNQLKMVYNRCKRNNLNIEHELFRLAANMNRCNRKRLFLRVRKKLLNLRKESKQC